MANAATPDCFGGDADGNVVASPELAAAGEAMDRIFGVPYFGTTV